MIGFGLFLGREKGEGLAAKGRRELREGERRSMPKGGGLEVVEFGALDVRLICQAGRGFFFLAGVDRVNDAAAGEGFFPGHGEKGKMGKFGNLEIGKLENGEMRFSNF